MTKWSVTKTKLSILFECTVSPAPSIRLVLSSVVAHNGELFRIQRTIKCEFGEIECPVNQEGAGLRLN